MNKTQKILNIAQKAFKYCIFPGTQKDKIFTEVQGITDTLHFEMQLNYNERNFIAVKGEKNLISVYKEWTHVVNGHRRGISYYVRICNDGTIKSCDEKFTSSDKFAKAIYEMFRSKWREQKTRK